MFLKKSAEKKILIVHQHGVVERNKGKEKPNNNTTSTDTDTTNNNGIAGITEKETDNEYDGLKKKVDAAWDE